MPSPAPWPEALAGTPAVAVIDRAISRERLANSLLLHGENLATLAQVAHGIADRLLNDPRRPAPHFPPKQHPDFFALRPAGRSRQIGVEPTRDLISRIQVSPQTAHRKVAVIYEADRMHLSAANIFLKTLEEPPASTVILLLTTRPYSLLATIRSRCLHFRFTDAGSAALLEADEPTRAAWHATRATYLAWLEKLTGTVTGKRDVADQVLTVYGLVTRFNAVLAAATDQAWEHQREKLPADLDDEEVAAIRTGIANGIRWKLFAEFEQATRDFGRIQLERAHPGARRNVVAAVTQLEQDIALLRLNLNEAVALEDFLLASLRIWSRR